MIEAIIKKSSPNTSNSKSKKELIGIWTGSEIELKEEYRRSDNKKNLGMVYTKIYLDNSKYGIRVEIGDFNCMWNELFYPRMTKEERELEKKRIEQIEKEQEEREKNGLPAVDTSNWVKPDTESITRALIAELVILEILRDSDSVGYMEAYGKAQAYFGILESHAPSNPQTITMFSIDLFTPLTVVLSVLKHEESSMPFMLQDKHKTFDSEKYAWDMYCWNEKVRKAIIKPKYYANKKVLKRTEELYKLKEEDELSTLDKKKINKEKKKMNRKFLLQDKRRNEMMKKAKEKYGVVPYWGRKRK